jgi:hypothetical protein
MPLCFADFQAPIPLAQGRAVLAEQIGQAVWLDAEADASGGLVPAAAARLHEKGGPRLYPLGVLWEGTSHPPRRIIVLRLNDECWRLEMVATHNGYQLVAITPAGCGHAPRVPETWMNGAWMSQRVAA